MSKSFTVAGKTTKAAKTAKTYDVVTRATSGGNPEAAATVKAETLLCRQIWHFSEDLISNAKILTALDVKNALAKAVAERWDNQIDSMRCRLWRRRSCILRLYKLLWCCSGSKIKRDSISLLKIMLQMKMQLLQKTVHTQLRWFWRWSAWRNTVQRILQRKRSTGPDTGCGCKGICCRRQRSCTDRPGCKNSRILWENYRNLCESELERTDRRSVQRRGRQTGGSKILFWHWEQIP